MLAGTVGAAAASAAAAAEFLAGTTAPWFVLGVELVVVAATALPVEAEAGTAAFEAAACWEWSTKAWSVSSSVASSTALSP